MVQWMEPIRRRTTKGLCCTVSLQKKMVQKGKSMKTVKRCDHQGFGGRGLISKAQGIFWGSETSVKYYNGGYETMHQLKLIQLYSTKSES